MPLDSSIPLQVKPVQFDSPYESQAKALQLKDMIGRSQLADMQLGQQRSAMERQGKLRDVYAGMKADTKESDRIAALRNAGFHDEADKWEGSALKRDETRSKISKEQYDLMSSRVEATNQALGALRALGRPPTRQDVYGVLGEVAQRFGIPPEDQSATVRSMPARDEDLPGWLTSRQVMSSKMADALKLLTPDLKTVNLGGTEQVIDLNSYTRGANAPTSFARTMTPGERDASARGWSNISLEKDKFKFSKEKDARDTEQGKWQYDAERGGVVNVKTGEFKPATQDGKPIGAKDKPMTDAQAKAALFGSRMEAADKIINDLAKDGVNKSVPGSRAPFGIGAAVNAVSPEKRQMLDQAKRDYINAVLRRESGAVISPEEFDNAEKQYFPQIGEPEAVIQQKARARAIAMRGIQAEVPNARKTVDGIIGGGPAGGAGSVKDLGGGFTLKN